jgi:UDP-glucose 4-epimerase
VDTSPHVRIMVVRILITGGGGYLGRVLTVTLREHGHEVTALDRSADLRDRSRLAAAIHAGSFDGVCHLAARTTIRDSFADPLGYYDTNLAGTLNLLSSLRDVPAVVFASTSAVYGSDRPGVLTEDLDPRPENPYAESKLAAEKLIGYHAAAGAVGAISLRCFNVAGSYGGVADPGTTRIIPAALRVAAGHSPHVRINGDGSAVREFTHVRDVADAFRLALTGAAAIPGTHQVLNVGTGRGVSMADVVRTVEKVTERPVPVIHGPAVNEPHTLVAGTDRIRAVLGWTPARSSLETIIRDSWADLSPDLGRVHRS